MITVDNVVDWHAAGPDHFWWHDSATDTYLITDAQEPPGDAALYLMPWDASWWAQWDGDWQAAADQLNEIIERQEK